eukprot:12390584-Karenia_brevis.AAC.1
MTLEAWNNPDAPPVCNDVIPPPCVASPVPLGNHMDVGNSDILENVKANSKVDGHCPACTTPMACAPMVASGSGHSHATTPILVGDCTGGVPAVRLVPCVQSLTATSSSGC